MMQMKHFGNEVTGIGIINLTVEPVLTNLIFEEVLNHGFTSFLSLI